MKRSELHRHYSRIGDDIILKKKLEYFKSACFPLWKGAFSYKVKLSIIAITIIVKLM